MAIRKDLIFPVDLDEAEKLINQLPAPPHAMILPGALEACIQTAPALIEIVRRMRSAILDVCENWQRMNRQDWSHLSRIASEGLVFTLPEPAWMAEAKEAGWGPQGKLKKIHRVAEAYGMSCTGGPAGAMGQIIDILNGDAK